jgi:hypothetical protein
MSAAMLGGELHVFGGWKGALLLGDFWRLSGNSSWSGDGRERAGGAQVRRDEQRAQRPPACAVWRRTESESDDLWLFSR